MWVERSEAPVLAVADQDRVAGPAPTAPAVIVSQEESDVALQTQLAPALMRALPNPPTAGMVGSEPNGAAAQPDERFNE